MTSEVLKVKRPILISKWSCCCLPLPSPPHPLPQPLLPRLRPRPYPSPSSPYPSPSPSSPSPSSPSSPFPSSPFPSSREESSVAQAMPVRRTKPRILYKTFLLKCSAVFAVTVSTQAPSLYPVSTRLARHLCQATRDGTTVNLIIVLLLPLLPLLPLLSLLPLPLLSLLPLPLPLLLPLPLPSSPSHSSPLVNSFSLLSPVSQPVLSVLRTHHVRVWGLPGENDAAARAPLQEHHGVTGGGPHQVSTTIWYDNLLCNTRDASRKKHSSKVG